MWRFLFQFSLIVWFRENLKLIFRAFVPILAILLIFTPLYWLWDSKLTQLGYGLHLSALYTILYLGAFFKAYFLLKRSSTNYENKKILNAKKAILDNIDRIEKFESLEDFPKLRKRKDRILDT